CKIETARSVQGAPTSPILPVPRDQALALSFAQERLWFLDQLDPGSAVYNIPAALRLRGRLDVGVLEASLREIARRHESLRTTFSVAAGPPAQEIAPEESVLAFPGIDLRGLGGAEREGELLRLALGEAGLPFDLTHGPLLRATLLPLAADEHAVFLTMH